MERSIRIPESGACVSVGAQNSIGSRGRTLYGVCVHTQPGVYTAVDLNLDLQLYLGRGTSEVQL